jgi:hypothetical protein
MQISIANAILVARLVGKSIVKLGLKMWLRFNKSNILGCELVVDGNFPTGTTAWELQGQWLISNNQASTVGTTKGPIYQDVLANGLNEITFTLVSGEVSIYTLFPSFGARESFTTPNTYTIKLESSSSVSNYKRLYFYNKDAGTSATIENVSVKEVAQFIPDDSNNCNEAKLFTGKALDFNGSTDYVEVPNSASLNIGTDDFTYCFWIYIATAQTQRIIDKRDTRGFTFYLDLSNVLRVELSDGTDNAAFILGTLTSSVWQRVVISADRDGNAICYINDVPQTPVDISSKSGDLTDTTSLFIGADAPNGVAFKFDGFITDIQWYDTILSQADATFDYNNPNHLVTDNPNSTVALSNLKGYWDLSEGAGSIAYDSSGEGNNGTIDGGTYDDQQTTIPQFGMMDWSKGSNLYLNSEPTSNESFALNITYTSYSWNYIGFKNATVFGDNSLTRIRYGGSVTSGLEYTLSAFVIMDDNSEPDITNTNSSGDFGLVLGNAVTGGTNTKTNVSGNIWRVSKTKTVTSATTNNGIIKYTTQSTKGFKVVGWQLEESSTVGSYIGTAGSVAINATLVQNPNNKGFDILGNPLRLREHSFNLDGSGYAEVADANSLDFGTGNFTIETWVKASYLSQGSSLNSIIALGGAMTDAGSAGIGVYNTTSKLAGYVGSLPFYSNDVFNSGDWYHVVITRDSGLCTMYVDSVAQTNTRTTNANITNSLVKYIGRDSNNNRFYSNLIDDSRLYNRALTQEEVTQNFNVGLPAHKNSSSYSDDYSSDYGF